MNTYYTIQFTDKTVIWTMYTMSSPTVKTRLTPKGVSRLNRFMPNSNTIMFKCTEAELANVIDSIAFFIKATLDVINPMTPDFKTADSELLLH